MNTIIDDILLEREKQRSYQYDEVHDDRHVNEELSKAAASYAIFDAPGYANGQNCASIASQLWPFPDGFQPRTQRENLIRATALLIAEIERIDRRDSYVG